jgi:AhpD family alkylhydroperoxidase
MSGRLDYMHVAATGIEVLGRVRGYVAQSGLPKTLIDLVYLRVSLINGCAYCIDMHSRELLKGGMAVEKLVLVPVWRDAGQIFSDSERAALAWAEVVTRVAETRVPDEEFEAAVLQFTDKELANLTIAIGLINTYNRLSISFRAMPLAAAQDERIIRRAKHDGSGASRDSSSDDD